jgi:Fe2+ transport system protein FeoA
MMQPLTKVMQGATCTVKWALGLPDIVEKLHALKIDQGSKLKVICKNRNDMIIGVGNKRYVIGNEIAGRIQV